MQISLTKGNRIIAEHYFWVQLWSLYVCIGVCLCVLYICACWSTHVFMDVWRQRLEVGCLPLLFSTLDLEAASLIKPAAHWLAGQLAFRILLCPAPRTGFSMYAAMTNFFKCMCKGAHARVENTSPVESCSLSCLAFTLTEKRGSFDKFLKAYVCDLGPYLR